MRVLLLHAFPLDPSMWESQRPVLEGHDVTAPVIYGRGNTMDSWATSLLEELDGPFDLVVGASMGGGCALALERLSPGFAGAIVLAGAHAGPDAPERRPAREEQIAELRAHADEAKVAVVEALRDRPDDRPVLQSFAGPVLVAVGDSDATIPVDTARSLAESARHGRLAVIEEAGHLVSLEQPEAFNTALAEFMEELS
jgi:pimeloyl-ACP methyl ester carboxylesterase